MDKAEIAMLTARAQSGDRAAFEALYNEFSDKIYYFAKRSCGSNDAAQDITSETFITALEHIGELKNEESFIGWLYTIAYSRCVNHIKDSSRTEHFEDNDELEKTVSDSALSEPVMLPEDYAANAEIKEKLKAVIDSLPNQQRAAVILYYYEDMSTAQVAKALGTNENNARQKLHKARKTIRKRIEKLLGGAVLCAVPLEALMSNTTDAACVRTALKAGKLAGRSLAVRVAAAGTAAAVAVGVPIAIGRLGDDKGDYQPDSIYEQADSSARDTACELLAELVGKGFDYRSECSEPLQSYSGSSCDIGVPKTFLDNIGKWEVCKAKADSEQAGSCLTMNYTKQDCHGTKLRLFRLTGGNQDKYRLYITRTYQGFTEVADPICIELDADPDIRFEDRLFTAGSYGTHFSSEQTFCLTQAQQQFAVTEYGQLSASISGGELSISLKPDRSDEETNKTGSLSVEVLTKGEEEKEETDEDIICSAQTQQRLDKQSGEWSISIKDIPEKRDLIKLELGFMKKSEVQGEFVKSHYVLYLDISQVKALGGT